MAGRDVIVVGASAGGVEALVQLAAGLPAILDRRGLRGAPPLALRPEQSARHPGPPRPAAGRARPGRPAHRARPDLRGAAQSPPAGAGGHVEVSHGPRENHTRPSIDPLFRSAARAFGPRVVGVVLSGTLDDGSLGLQAVRAHGGMAVVQDPSEALFGDMPRAALRQAGADYVLGVRGLRSQRS